MAASQRILCDLPPTDVQLLDQLSERSKRSRAALVREAISAYLEPHRRSAVAQGRGLWCDLEIDRVNYQERLRDEWQ